MGSAPQHGFYVSSSQCAERRAWIGAPDIGEIGIGIAHHLKTLGHGRFGARTDRAKCDALSDRILERLETAVGVDDDALIGRLAGEPAQQIAIGFFARGKKLALIHRIGTGAVAIRAFHFACMQEPRVLDAALRGGHF